MAQAATKPQQPPQRQMSKQELKNQYLTTVAEPRIPFVPEAESEFGVDERKWIALCDAIWPSAKSVNGVMLALAYCRARKLDPFKRPVHIVPMWNAKLGFEVETIWPGISELRTTAARTGGYAGFDECRFGPMKTQTFKDRVSKWRDGNEIMEDESVTVTFPEWAQITVYRMVGEQRCAFPGPKVQWLHAYGRRGKTSLPNEMWARRPDEQLEKCCEAAALRRAFPEEMGDMISAEEMAGQHVMDLGGGATLETPIRDAGGVTGKQRPQRSDFAGTAQAKDVAADGSTEGGASEPEGMVAYDEVGEGTSCKDEAAFAIAVSGFITKATTADALKTIYANNIELMNTLAAELNRPLFKQYADAIKAAGKPKPAEETKKGGKPDKATKTASDKEAEHGFALKNIVGKVVESGLDAGAFAIEIDKLFQAAEMKVDLAAIERNNRDAIAALPENHRADVIEAYDKAGMRFGHN